MAREATSIPLALVGVRVSAGLILLTHGWSWLHGEGPGGDAIRRATVAALPDLARPLAWWGEAVVLYNPDAMGFFWRWSAFLFGLALVLGALTRPAGTLAALVLCHGLLYGPPQHDLTFTLLLVSCLASATGGAGLRLGLDAAFDQHFPSWLTWARRKTSFLS